MSDPVLIMAGCFVELGKPKLESLVKHEMANTPICCGPDAALLTDGAGGACPAVLACEAMVPMVRLDALDWDATIKKEKRAKAWLSAWISLLSKDLSFTMALNKATQNQVKQAIRIAFIFSGHAPEGAGLIVPYTNSKGKMVNLICIQSDGRMRIFEDAVEDFEK